MDNNYLIEKAVRMYFDGCNVSEVLNVIKTEKKEYELKKIVIAWENKAKKAQVCQANGWKYQQPKLI